MIRKVFFHLHLQKNNSLNNLQPNARTFVIHFYNQH
jgi:hypothetical protein